MSNPVDSSFSSNIESVETFFQKHVARLNQTLASLEQQIDPDAVPKRNNVHHLRLLRAIQDSVSACKEFQAKHNDDPALIREVQLRFLKETDRYFHASWFAHRARTKPAGFVGDHEMLSKLYDQATPAPITRPPF